MNKKEQPSQQEEGLDTIRFIPPEDAKPGNARRIGRQIDQELYQEQIEEAFKEAEKMAEKEKLEELAKIHKTIEENIDNLEKK